MPDMTFQALDPTGLNETAEQVRAIVQETKAQIEEELNSLSYAKPDGIYPDMTVGAVIGADETSQWATRESDGSGSATVRSVQGAAVAWNQLNQNNRNSATINGVTFTNNNDGTWTVNGTATSDVSKEVGTVPRVTDNKYLVRGCPSGGSASTYFVSVAGGVHDVGDGYIYTSPTYTSTALYIVVKSGATVDNLVFTPQLFNLTAMFGSGNEPSTVAEFERMFPKAYYPYSAPILKPVQIAGIASTDAQGGELDAIEWTAQTLWGAGTAGDVLYADHKEINIGAVDLGTLTWSKTDDARIDVGYYFQAFNPQGITSNPNKACAKYTVILDRLGLTNIIAAYGASVDKILFSTSGGGTGLYIIDSAYTTAAEFKAAMSGVLMYFELATPTTTPISPALPMTYKVQQGGSESIIVPDGEVNAAPVLTIAEPVNMSTELARIWAAIEALQGSRGSALESVRSDSDVSSTEVKEAPTMDEKQTTERESEA